jgi:hypothetical protein
MVRWRDGIDPWQDRIEAWLGQLPPDAGVTIAEAIVGALEGTGARLADKAAQSRVGSALLQAGWKASERARNGAAGRRERIYKRVGPPRARGAVKPDERPARAPRDTPEPYEPPPWIPLREFVESPEYCGLKLSPVVAAICDAADGNPVVTLDEVTARRVFAVALEQLAAPRARPSTVVVIAGGQGGKTTRLGAPAMLHAAWCVPAPNAVEVGPDNYLRQVGRPPRVLIIAPDRDLADGAFESCKAFVASSPVLRKAMIEALPRKARTVAKGADDDEYAGLQRKILLRRPDGITVEIVVRAALRRGTSARSAPLLGVLLDEACFFEDEGSAVNDAEIVRAATQRLVGPLAQIWLVSTPWEEQTGEAMRLVRERDEAPEAERQRDVLVVGGSAEHHVSTLDLFPGWDPDGRKRKLLEKDEANFAREVLGVPLPAGSARWFPPAAVELAFRLEPFAGSPVGRGAGSDFAFERDNSAQVIVDRFLGDLFDLRDVAEQSPSASGLKPSVVCEEAAKLLLRHGVRELVGDAHYRKSVEEELGKHGVRFVDAPTGNDGKWDTYALARDLMVEGRLRLAGARSPERLRANLGRVLKKPLAGGRWQIYVPRIKGRGHADDVSALVLAVWHARASASLPRATDLARTNASFPTWGSTPAVTVDRGDEGAVDWAASW